MIFNFHFFEKIEKTICQCWFSFWDLSSGGECLKSERAKCFFFFGLKQPVFNVIQMMIHYKSHDLRSSNFTK